MLKEQKNITIILSFPRCGTHFMWGEFIKSEQYQLLYDADRIPALHILGNAYAKTLDFLCTSETTNLILNPNYNFQYNSLIEWGTASLTAQQHLNRLKKKYMASSVEQLFHNIIKCQDHGTKELLSINRFIYTVHNDSLFDNFEWTTQHALEACNFFLELLKPYNVQVVLVIRKYEDWLLSRQKMMGSRNLVKKESESMSIITRYLAQRDIRTFYMDDVIQSMKQGHLRFWEHLSQLSHKEIDQFCAKSAENKCELQQLQSTSLIRPERLLRYITTNDPFRRLAMVRSIGSVPTRLLPFIPFFKNQIERDLSGSILNNAKIDIDSPNK